MIGLVGLGTAAGLGGASPAQTGRPQKPNVLLITLDTTRADRMGFLGSSRGLTPSLDALAAGALVFTRAFSQAPITTASHATILTGTFPPFHHVSDFGTALGAEIPYLPDVLHAAGYETGAFVGSLILDPRNGTAPGFDRGFDAYDAGFRTRRPGEDRYHTVERRGEDVAARASEWVRSAGRGPWFVWVHLYDAHDPYDPPGDLKRQFAAAPYDGEIAGVDRVVGRLMELVEGRPVVVAVAADHGEALGDHGEETHGVFLYDAVLHVPFLVKLPGVAGRRVTTRVRLADVAPTILDACGVTIPKAMQGQSVLPLASRDGVDRPSYAETQYPLQAFGWSPLTSWRADRFLYVQAPKPELYDVVADPNETKNLAASRSRVVDGMRGEMQAFLGRAGGSSSPGGSGGGGSRGVDPDLQRRLAALGYVSGGGAGGSGAVQPAAGRGAGAPAADPKDHIASANALHRAVLEVEDGAFQRAIPLLEQVTTAEPNIPLAQLQLGIARARQREYARAVGPLRKAIALQPTDMFAHYELGVALYETGDLRTAAGHFEIVASRMPNWADARYSLGSVYVRIDRVPDGVKELRAALAVDAHHFRANLLLGRILTLQGNAAGAVPYLREAVAQQPANAEAKRFLDEAVTKARR